jgi:hypothetical protein
VYFVLWNDLLGKFNRQKWRLHLLKKIIGVKARSAEMSVVNCITVRRAEIMGKMITEQRERVRE